MEISPLQSSLAANHALTVNGRCSVSLAQTGQHYPGDACQLIGDGHVHLVARCACCQAVHPLVESAGVAHDAPQRRSCSMHEHFAQIGVAAVVMSDDVPKSGGPSQLRC